MLRPDPSELTAGHRLRDCRAGNDDHVTTTVVVTGASAGVGRATVKAFARAGASVALLARDRDGLEGAAKDVEAEGGTSMVCPLDVADADAVEAAADRIEVELGPIAVWVNNAMVSVFSPVHDLAADEVRRVTEVTYLGTVHGTLSALRRMRPRDRGHDRASRLGAG